jgi:HEAT repeat protein
MTKKKWAMGGAAVFGVTLGVLMIIPLSRKIIIGTLRNEPKENDKFMSQWIEELGNDNEEARYQATSALSKMTGDTRAALPALLKAMSEDPDDKVRSGAAFAVYWIASRMRMDGTHPTEAVPALIVALKDPDSLTRMNASMALFMMREDAISALPELQAAIGRKENKRKVLLFTLSIREQMMAVLGGMGAAAKGAVPFLEKWLDDDEWTTRQMAARVLGKIGPDAKHAVPAMVKMLENEAEPENVQETVREAIELIDPATAAKLAKK